MPNNHMQIKQGIKNQNLALIGVHEGSGPSVAISQSVTRDEFQTGRIVDGLTDNKFLACALEIKADCIVSGDNHLLHIKHFHGTQLAGDKTFITKIKEK